MRIRTVKPEFWQSESNGKLTRDARLIFIGLMGLADDEGRLRAHPGFVTGQLLPFDPDGRKVIDRALAELERAGKIQRYDSEGSAFAFVVNFTKHQKIDARYPSKIPAPPVSASSSPIPADQSGGTVVSPPVAAESPPIGSGNGIREQGSGNGSAADAIEALRLVWNAETRPPVPTWKQTGALRRKAAKAALERRQLDGPGGWTDVFRALMASPLCRGEVEGGWIADIDWALRPEGRKPEPAAKLLEGGYARGKKPIDITKGRVGVEHSYPPQPGKMQDQGFEF